MSSIKCHRLHGDTLVGTLDGQKRINNDPWPRNALAIGTKDRIEAVYAQNSSCQSAIHATFCIDSLFQPSGYGRHSKIYWIYDGIYIEENGGAKYLTANEILLGKEYPGGLLIVSSLILKDMTNLLEVPNPLDWKYQAFTFLDNGKTEFGNAIYRHEEYLYVFGKHGFSDTFCTSTVSMPNVLQDQCNLLEYT